jgi:hypothetical protein
MNDEPSFMDFNEAFQNLTYQHVEDWLDKLEKHGMLPGWIGELPSEWSLGPIPPWLRG